MKNNKGFTLVEIIVSIALLGIISVGMIAGLTAQFQFLTDTQSFTEALAAVQQQMEQAIYQNKLDIKNGETPDGTPVAITLFDGTAYERTVTGYSTDETITAGGLTVTLDAVVGPKMLDLPVANVDNVDLVFKTTGSIFETKAYTYSSNLYASSSISLADDENVSYYSDSIYHWYVSRPGFNIPMISSTPGETEMGTIYPRFPADYELIPGVSASSLSSVASRYEGRHIVCTATPFAPSYKMGDEVASNPLFISGLPVKSDLAMHLDASMIDREDTTNQVRASGDDFYVKKWRDISGKDSSATPPTTDRQPRLVEYYIGYIIYDGVWYDSYAKYASFDGGDWLSASFSGTADTSGTASTVFVVARDAGATNFTIYKNTVPAQYVSFASGWGTTTATIGNNSGAAVDVAEVIVYTAKLSDEDAQAVTDYLEDKYLPETPDVAIRWLNNVSVTVVQNSTYTPPATVSAYMTSGRYQDVAVTWNPAAIDTTTLGTKASTGTAVSDSSQTCRLSVTVVAPTELTGIAPFTVYSSGAYGVLTAGALSPTGATATYQWQISNDGGANWENITGATSSVYSTGVWGSMYRVAATGNGLYTGTVYSEGQTLTVTPLTAIDPITLTGGGTYAALTAGDLTPAAATADYQWQISYDSGANWQNVSGATSKTYSYASWGSLYRVVATGNGGYSGTVTSASYTVTQVSLTGIAPISIYWSGNTPILTAGAVSPTGATVNYQWQIYTYFSGWYGGYWDWQNISGATTSTYTASMGEDYRVIATGNGMYTGTATSADITAAKTPLSDIGDIVVTWNTDGTPVLTAGALSPSGATATYQWQSYYYGWYNITSATSASYTGASTGNYYRVVATGSNGYSGIIYSDYIYLDRTSLSSIGSISVAWNNDGTPVMAAGAVSPSGATFNYLWQYYSSGWHNIDGATASTYAGTAGTQYRVTATGYGGYYGTVNSSPVTPTRTALTSIGAVTVSWSSSGVPTMTAGTVYPTSATFTYQWLVYSDGSWNNISGATTGSYTGTAGTQYRVTAIGTGAYYGTVGASVTPTRTELTNIGAVTVSWSSGGTPTMTSGAVSPSGATVTYQWQTSNNGGSSWSDISGATASSYTGTVGTLYRVTATGTGAYYGTVSTSCTPNRINVTDVNISISWSGSTPTLTAVVTPGAATVTYQWTSSGSTVSTVASFIGVIGRTYTLTVTGYGEYTGTQTDTATAKISVTGIGNIYVYSWSNAGAPTLRAGSVTPSGASVTYQWLDSSGNAIYGATSSTFTGTAGQTYYVKVTGSGNYTGSVTSDPFTPVHATITNVTISRFNNTLTANLAPSGATVNYQWQRKSNNGTTWSNTGSNRATNNFNSSYDYRVIVTGYGEYTDSSLTSNIFYN